MKAKMLLGACAATAVLAGCLDSGPTGPACNSRIANTTQAMAGDTVVTTVGLRYIETQVGTGATATACKAARVNYALRLAADTTRTVDSGTFTFTPGVPNEVISGFALGVLGLKVGGKRRVIVPPELGYGATAVTNPNTGQVEIPANSTLIFDLELLEVEP